MTGEKIMIVDENQDFLNDLGDILSSCGYAVMLVSNSAEALSLAVREKPRVILFDQRKSGSEATLSAEDFGCYSQTRHIPVIAMSGYFPYDNNSILSGMNDMEERIENPFPLLDLITNIERVLNTQNTGIPDFAVL
jgi:CheY-like chemotaxis protein